MEERNNWLSLPLKNVSAYVFLLLVPAALVHSYGPHSYPSRYSKPGMSGGHQTRYEFPPGFLIGVASSSYQIEGAWDEDGKGESEIDHYIKMNPNWTADGLDGKIACDSYHQYLTDIELIKNLKADFYRFSISWSRIFPTGDPTNVNQLGLDYYNKLINALLENGIKPVVTIYHWDMPQKLIELGGWTNRIIIEYFEAFANILFRTYGDRVKWWVTLNEPILLATFGYGQGVDRFPVHPPGYSQSGVADYMALHHLLLAHARVYRMYQAHFKKSQNGKVGIVGDIFAHKPATDKKEDIDATERANIFALGRILHPLLSPEGNYPPLMREIVDKNSKAEGRIHSRLPHFTRDEIIFLKGALDFVGLNYYTQFLVSNGEVGKSPSSSRDSGAVLNQDPNSKIPGVSWLAHEPEGLRRVLNWVKKNYRNPPVFITENGCDDPKGINDTDRISYVRDHMKAMLNAMKEDGCNVIGYTLWSLMDSFEWSSGYTAKFGLYQVDFSDPNRRRTPKQSVQFFKDVLHKRHLNNV